jgi:hypothetical protein
LRQKIKRKKCKEQQEEIRLRWEMKEREATQALEADKERNMEAARRAKETSSNAIGKGKIPLLYSVDLEY